MLFFFLFKQKTSYEMRISDWSSDVCSSDLIGLHQAGVLVDDRQGRKLGGPQIVDGEPTDQVLEQFQLGATQGVTDQIIQRGVQRGLCVGTADRKSVV